MRSLKRGNRKILLIPSDCGDWLFIHEIAGAVAFMRAYNTEQAKAVYDFAAGVI